MTARFLILMRDQPGALDGPALASRLDLALSIDRPEIVALTSGDIRCYAFGDGHVFGTLYPRYGPPKPIETLQIECESKIDAEERLRTRFWGNYVALFSAQARRRLVRDPSAALPCYYAETAFGLAIASDVALLRAAGAPEPRVNWPALVRYHYLHGLPSPETCLHGIEELLAGYSLDVSLGKVDQRVWWSPWDHLANEEVTSTAALGDLVRRAAKASAEALTSTHDRLLLSVSGGLDSSIVAACLAHAGRDISCVTMFTDDPAGDERLYARALCNHLGFPLIERAYRADAIDLDAAMSPHLPRPVGRMLAQAYERAHLDVAQAIGADAFVTGNGGDNVFGYSQSAGAVVDRYLQDGLTLGLLRTIADVSRQTESSPTRVVRAAWQLKRRKYQWTPGPMFLDPAMLAGLAPEHVHQPWLDAPSSVGPGKAAHVASLLRVQQLLEPGRSRFAPVITPLIAQPVIEACLAVPSWHWRTGGRDRALARDAFAADLPPAIIGRHAKGGPDGFSAVILRQHRNAIRDRLLDGALARNHVVDRSALEARFRSEQPFSGEEQGRLLDLADTEAWARSWSGSARPVS